MSEMEDVYGMAKSNSKVLFQIFLYVQFDVKMLVACYIYQEIFENSQSCRIDIFAIVCKQTCVCVCVRMCTVCGVYVCVYVCVRCVRMCVCAYV